MKSMRIQITCILLLSVVLIISSVRSGRAHPPKPGPAPRFYAQTLQDTTARKKTLKLLLDKIEVQGWIDRPQMVYVVPGINPEIDDIILDRSFLDEILRPLDKDKFEKQKVIAKKTIIPW